MAKRGRKPIDEKIVEKIRKLYKEGHPTAEIAKICNVSPFVVSKHTKNIERTVPTKGEVRRLLNAAKEIGIDEEKVREILPKLSKREVVLYALNLIRLRPFISRLEEADGKRSIKYQN